MLSVVLSFHLVLSLQQNQKSKLALITITCAHHTDVIQIVTVRHISLCEFTHPHRIKWRSTQYSVFGDLITSADFVLVPQTFKADICCSSALIATLLSFLLKCWWALVLLFRNVGSPSLSFETLCYWFLLNMTSWLLTKQNTGICFQWKHERNNLKQRHSLVLGVQWNELVLPSVPTERALFASSVTCR